jgi:hypothetical protein
MANSRLAIVAAATVILLVGCSSGSTSPAAPVSGSISSQIAHAGVFGKPLSVIPEALRPHGPRVRPTWWRDAPAGSNAKKTSPIKTIVVSMQESPSLPAYSQTGSEGQKMTGPICTISGQSGVTDIGEDTKGDVYVPYGNTDTVSVFAPDCGAQIGSYSDPYGQPVDIAFPPRDGNGSAVKREIIERTQDAVFDIVGSSGSEYGNVALCTTAKGCTSELTDPSINTVYAGAFDSAGNVWASYLNQENVPALIVWPNGKMPGEVVSGYVNSGVGSLEFDAKGNLLAIDSSLPGVVSYTCTVPNARRATSVGCDPNHDWDLNGHMLYGKLVAKGAAFDVADFSYGSIDVYSYPSFTYQYSYIQGLNQSDLVVGLTGVPIQGSTK